MHERFRTLVESMYDDREQRLIAEHAGHHAIAESMKFTDHGEVELERLESERAAERRSEGS